MKEKLASLIRDEDFERIELIQKKPNIFESLDLVRMELKHSRFLSWLLDPGENHGLGDTFLKKFLRDIFSDDKAEPRVIFAADALDFTKVEIRREWRHIDILVILKDDVVVIENKIGSSDHSHQLSRYKKIIDDDFKSISHKHFVYLTPEGEDPSEEEAVSYYITYSYSRIARILENVIGIYGESLNDRSRIYVEDYLTMVKRFILMNDTLNDLAVSVYKSHRDALDFIFENKPDMQLELSEYLKELISKSSEELNMDSSSKTYIRFCPKIFDDFERFRTGDNQWTKSSRVLIYEFQNFEKGLFLKLIIGPSVDESIRNEIYAKAKSARSVFSPNPLRPRFTTILKIDFLTKKNLDKNDIDDLKIRVKEKFDEFMSKKYQIIKEFFKKSFET